MDGMGEERKKESMGLLARQVEFMTETTASINKLE
jgi:hypothetical protein